MSLFSLFLFAGQSFWVGLKFASTPSPSTSFPPVGWAGGTGPSVVSAASPDAIAIRIIPNSDHYSAERWYKEQGFLGSPQTLSVDGYEAIRDGRTVYVNAANIVGGALYTNIYLISYNQSAETATEDIFSQILSHWKFNTNISGVGNCGDSETACLSDADCPDNSYCSSPKAKITRDVKRLADLADMEIVLEEYYNSHDGQYPRLSAGTYLPGITVSTWPSWQETLAKELNQGSLPIDTINKLGDCGATNFDPITCWDEKGKMFADPEPGNDIFELPDNSRVYVYEINFANQVYTQNLCAVMESVYAQAASANACHSGTSSNTAPAFLGSNLPTAYSGESYIGYISAFDPDGDSLGWDLNTGLSMWNLWNSPPSSPAAPQSPPSLQSTNVSSQKAIRANQAGIAGNYEFEVIIDDGKLNGQATQGYNILTVNQNLPVIQAQDNKTAVIGHDLTYTVEAQEADSQYPLIFTVNGLPNGLSWQAAANQHDFTITGAPITETQTYNITAMCRDYYQGNSNTMTFNIMVINHPPVITSVPPSSPVVGCVDAYNYPIIAADPDNHTLEYLIQDPPNGLDINSGTGVITGLPVARANTFPIIATVRDQYYTYTNPATNAQTDQSFDIIVEDEAFNVNQVAVSDTTIYVFPSQVSDISRLYYQSPLTYFGNIQTTSQSPGSYSLSNYPGFLAVDANTGEIQGTPTNNANHPGTYNITVTATNNCAVSYSNNFTLTVLSNQWCGDSAIQTNFSEECDDGANGANTDQCTDQCTKTYCGDNIAQAPNGYNYTEECDDANSSNNDNCLNSCQNAGCGDGYLWSGHEACDDGNNIDGDGCNTISNNCQLICGDGRIDLSEACDDGNSSNSDQCKTDCTKTYCGDNIAQAPNGYNQNEQCDDGNSSNSDSCRSNCQNAICGDGYVWSGHEQCDDANTNNNDACLNSCQNAICGDGYVRSGVEQCDDGNSTNGDGCNTTTANCQHVCGDGHVDLGEQCDDGNTSDSDQCRNDCAFSYCGDGVIQAPNNAGQNEQCEGMDLEGKTCSNFGYNGGLLICSNCQISYSGCCNNECSGGSTRCVNSSTQQTCSDHNGDGCNEWGNNQSCNYGCGGSPGHCLNLTTYNPACYYGTHAIEYCSNGNASAFCSYKGAVTYYSWGYASTGSPVAICGTCCDNVNCDCYGFNYCQWISCLY